jgi:hypothetical protein
VSGFEVVCLAAFGTACYLFGLLTGARLIPWLVDRGWFPVRRHHDLLLQQGIGAAFTGAR